MSAYSKSVWNQIKNTTVQELAAALIKDGWVQEPGKDATIGFRHADRNSSHNRVVLHVHPKGTKGPKLMKGLLRTIGWSENDLEHLGLIKRRRKKPST